MSIPNLKSLHACNPNFDICLQREENYYVNLAAARGEDAVKRMRRAIALSPNKPTHQLLAGHSGSGKSTELLRLKLELEQQGFCVIYFVADSYANINRVGVIDIWLMMIQPILHQLEKTTDSLSLNYFANAIITIERLMRIPVPVGNFTYVSRLQKILQVFQDHDQQDHPIRSYLEPRIRNLLIVAIEEVTTMEIDRLKHLGKKGLVMLVDNLDRMPLEQMEIVFSEGGKYLRQFQCHTIYTIPFLAIAQTIAHTDDKLQQQFQKYGNAPIVLPPIKLNARDGSINSESLNLLRQVVLARILPDLSPAQRLEQVTAVFDRLETLDQLCIASYGHLPYLLSLLQGCLQRQGLPINLEILQQVISSDRHLRQSSISNGDRQTLQQCLQNNQIPPLEALNLCRRLLIFEHHDADGYWFTSPY